MPHTVEQLRTREGRDVAYILLIDGIPYGFVTAHSHEVNGQPRSELVGSGPNSFIGRAEADAGETVGGRTLLEGLQIPMGFDLGDIDLSGTSPASLSRSVPSFSFLLHPECADYFMRGGFEPEEMLGHLPASTDPAPATVVGVQVRDRHIGLECIGPNGERRMFPFIMGQNLPGYEHFGDTDGFLVPASVTTRPVVHEGRPCALYRVFRDASAASTANSDAWPSLSNYEPIWFGKINAITRYQPGRRTKIQCLGRESLLEKTMGAGGATPFNINPEFTTSPGVDDQVAIWFGSGEQIQPDFEFQTVGDTYEGRNWTTLSGSTPLEIRANLDDLIQDTVIGSGTDYNTAGSPAGGVQGINAGFQPGHPSIFIRKDVNNVLPLFFAEMRVAMHRRRWLALGFDPEQQDVEPDNSYGLTDTHQIRFRKLDAGDVYEPRPGGGGPMGVVPGTGYYAGIFNTIRLGAEGPPTSTSSYAVWDNNGSNRYYDPIFVGVETPTIINTTPGQVIRMATTVPLLNQPHLHYSGSIDGTPCNAAGYFKISGKIRRAEGSTDDGTLVVDNEAEAVVIARCSWVQAPNTLFADIGGGVTPALYVEQLYDPRKFGYAFRPLDRDWAATEVKMQQIFTWASASDGIERADQTLSALLRSTGTSPGQVGGVIQQGVNDGTSGGWFGDVFAASMSLGIPSSLLPSGDELTELMSTALPEGIGGELVRCRPVFEKPFSATQVLRALLEPRNIGVGYSGSGFRFFPRAYTPSPEEAEHHISESDLYGQMGDPTDAYPEQEGIGFRLHPVDRWRFGDGGRGGVFGTRNGSGAFEQRALDETAKFRMGGRTVEISDIGLIKNELFTGDVDAVPLGARWKNEVRDLFGHQEARFRTSGHYVVTLKVNPVLGEQLHPGTVVTVSNPWVFSPTGEQGISGAVGRVTDMRWNSNGRQGYTVDVLIMGGDGRPTPHFAPALWIESVNSSTELEIATSSDFTMGGGSLRGWTRPEWSNGAGGNLIGALMRMLPDGTWTVVGTAEVGSVNETTVSLATPLSAMPPTMARTMMLVPDVMANQPAWAQEIYSAVGIQGDDTRVKRFV